MSTINLNCQNFTSAASEAMLLAMTNSIDAAGPGAYIQLGRRDLISDPFESQMQLTLPHPCANAPANGEITLKDIPLAPATMASAPNAWRIFDADDNLIVESNPFTGSELAILPFVQGQPVKLSSVKFGFIKTSGPAEPVIPTNPEFPRTWAIDLPFSFEEREIPTKVTMNFLFEPDENHYHPDWFNSLSLEMHRFWTFKVGERNSWYFSHSYHSGTPDRENDGTYQTLTVHAEYSPDFDQIIITAETSSPWIRLRNSDYLGECIFSIGYVENEHNNMASYDPAYWNSTVSAAYAPVVTMHRPDIPDQTLPVTAVGSTTGNYNRGSMRSPQNVSVHRREYSFPLEL